MNFRREPSLQLKLNSTTFSPGVEGLIAFSDLLKDALKDVKNEPNTEVNRKTQSFQTRARQDVSVR